MVHFSLAGSYSQKHCLLYLRKLRQNYFIRIQNLSKKINSFAPCKRSPTVWPNIHDFESQKSIQRRFSSSPELSVDRFWGSIRCEMVGRTFISLLIMHSFTLFSSHFIFGPQDYRQTLVSTFGYALNKNAVSVARHIRRYLSIRPLVRFTVDVSTTSMYMIRLIFSPPLDSIQQQTAVAVSS